MSDKALINFQVSNMTCASCVARVEKALMADDAVESASVNLATESVQITYSDHQISENGLLSLLENAGYPGTPVRSAREDQQEQRARNIRSYKSRFLIAAVLTLPVVVLSMGAGLSDALSNWLSTARGLKISWIIQWLLTTLVMLWPGNSLIRTGWKNLIKRRPDMNSLVAIGTTAAWTYSVVATFFTEVLPTESRAVYFEASAVIISLVLLGRYFEARAKGQTGAAVEKLLALQAPNALVETDGGLHEMPIDDIQPGFIVHVRPGESVPADGLVIRGSSFVNESMITGEPIPVEKVENSKVTGGTLNGSGLLVVSVTQVGADSVLAQIVRLVQEAQGSRLPIQDLVNVITAWFVPAILGIALVTFGAWLFFAESGSLTFALVTSVAVLIIACPCAMGLATPTSIMVGTGRAAEMGVLFQQGDSLQTLQSVKTLAMDKTGTLTEGHPELVAVQLAPEFNDNDVLSLVASLEQASEHPVAKSIVAAAKARKLNMPECSDFNATAGMGVSGDVEGKRVLVGADRFLTSQGIQWDSMTAYVEQFAGKGHTPILVSIDGVCAGVLSVADPIKANAKDIVQKLQAMDVRVAMLTGDNRLAAQHVANELGIDEVVAEVLPDGKVESIKTYQDNGDKVAFVGDGMNDAPALATADVGMAIGTGTDIAIESSDVVLLSGDLSGVANAIAISKHTMRNIKQNLFWAFAYNILLIPVAAGLLYPFTGQLLSPKLAAAAMAFSSIFVLLNALRLRWIKAQ